MKTKSKYVHQFKTGHWAEVDLGQNVSTDLSLAAAPLWWSYWRMGQVLWMFHPANMGLCCDIYNVLKANSYDYSKF